MQHGNDRQREATPANAATSGSPGSLVEPSVGMFSPAYKGYALAAMTIVYTANLLDRGLIIMLLQPIKDELKLSDTQLGFLTGIAFGLFYATLGVPIARWADRGNRVTITSLAIGLWGLTVMSCVLVTNYTQLVFARIAAAVGEAGCRPPIYSLIGDYFPQPAARTRAMYLYDVSGPLATLTSFMAAGWLNENFGWRQTFFIVGIPGLLLAVIFKLTVVEPRARVTLNQARAAPDLPSMREVLHLLWHQRSCRHLTLAMILVFTISHGLGPWYAAFMMRIHHMGTGELGVWMGLTTAFSVLAGLLIGAYVVDRWFKDNARGQLRLSGATVAMSLPLFVTFLMVRNKHLALIALIPQALLISSFLPTVFVLLQRLVPDAMRATMFAVVMLLANLIGMGIGPQSVGILSDLLAPTFGVDALRYAMLIVSLLLLGAGYYLWRAGNSINEDLTAVGPWTAPAPRALPRESIAASIVPSK